MTEKDYEKFQEDLEQVSLDVGLGKLVTVNFLNGPLEGATRVVSAENGVPVRMTGYFVVPSVIQVGVPVEHAKYEWSIPDGLYVYAGDTYTKPVNFSI